MKRIIYTFFLIFFVNFLQAQEYFFSLNTQAKNNVEGYINEADTIAHTAFLPIRVYYANLLCSNEFFINGISANDLRSRKNFSASHKPNKFWYKLFADDLIVVDEENLKFSLNPMLNYYQSRVKDDNSEYWQNTRAFEIHGTLGEKLSFYTDFFESQAYFIPYVNDKANQTMVVPGRGSWKDFRDIGLGKDFNNASGYLSYSPYNFLNISFGHSKHFIGSGYRSVLLSDNSYNYPFARFIFTQNKLQYTAMFTEFQNFTGRYYSYHRKRHGTFLLLNYAPLKNMEIGLFEGIIWQTSDDSTYAKRFPALFFVPVPLVREAVYGLDGNNNALLGINFRWGFGKYAEIYGQFALDDWQKTDFHKRFAYQAGAKIYDIFMDKIAKQRFLLQTEYNYAKPYTYTSRTSAFVNMNEPLVNTLGAGFAEFVAIATWDFYGFSLSAKFNNILTSTDTIGSNFGVDLLKTDVNANFENETNCVGQGNKTNISLKTITFAYFINRKTNLQIFSRVVSRDFASQTTQNNIFFVEFGIRNFVRNFYDDF